MHIPKELEHYINKAAEYYNIISNKNNVAWLPSTYFKRTLKQHLKKDCETLLEMITLCGDWNQETDQKLNELQNLLERTHKDEKVIVFTQYSDTALYVYNQLRKRGVNSIGIATGDSDNPTLVVEKFSPISNEKAIYLKKINIGY